MSLDSLVDEPVKLNFGQLWTASVDLMSDLGMPSKDKIPWKVLQIVQGA